MRCYARKQMISDYLKAFRERARLTQTELAYIVGVQTQTVWRWEHGEREPSLDMVKKLCEILGCTESELFNGLLNDKIELLVSWNWEDMKREEMSMEENKFKLVLGEDGQIGINGIGMLTSHESINEFLGQVREQLEVALDAQVRRGVIHRM